MGIQTRFAWSPLLVELTHEGWGSSLWTLKEEQRPKKKSTLAVPWEPPTSCGVAESPGLEGTSLLRLQKHKWK